MKVQIVRPFSVLSTTTYSAIVTLPLGPAYLAAVLERAGHQVSILDALGEGMNQIRRSRCGTYNFQGLSEDELLNRIDPSIDFLGISLMFSQEWIPHREFVRAVRYAYRHLHIVVGGEHPTALPEYVLEDGHLIDQVVMGEGEYAFLDVVEGRDVRRIVRPAPRIREPDALPRPAWHLCKVDNYHSDQWSFGLPSERTMPILGTRGCPYQCTFCSSPQMWTTRYVMRDPADVVDEIEWLIREYRATAIEFFDLTAIVKKSWILQFCTEVKARGLTIPWQLPSGTRSEVIDGEVLRALHDAGCRFICYAPESGSEESLIQIKKRVKLPRLIASARAAVAIGQSVKINIIIGFPHERLRNILATLWFITKMAWYGIQDCNIAAFTPYPGSELYTQLAPTLNDAYFRNLLVQFDMTKAISYTPHLSARALAIWRVIGYILFYGVAYATRPWCHHNLFEQRISDFITRWKLARA